MNEYSLFFSNNKYLGECLIVAIRLDAINHSGLTSDTISIFIKYNRDIDLSKKIKDIYKGDFSLLFNNKHPIHIRLYSECILGIYGDTHCDCEEHRLFTLDHLSKKEQAIIINLPQEGMGRGLTYKLKELNIQFNGTTPDAKQVGVMSHTQAGRELLGEEVIDIRKYTFIGEILKKYNLTTFDYNLITGNPHKLEDLKISLGINITKVYDIKTVITIDNLGEIISKIVHKNYFATTDQILQIRQLINSNAILPERAHKAIGEMKNMSNAHPNHHIKREILTKHN